MNITWWHWLALGLVLIALEMAASGGFYVVFFGIAAIVIGTLALFGSSLLILAQRVRRQKRG